MTKHTQIVTLEECKILQITPDALYLDFEGVQEWVPSSQCSCSESIEIDQQFDIDMPMCLAQEKGFI